MNTVIDLLKNKLSYLQETIPTGDKTKKIKLVIDILEGKNETNKMSYKIRLIEAETDKQVGCYEASIVPKVGDEVKIKRNRFLFITHRVFNMNNNTIVHLYGQMEN